MAKVYIVSDTEIERLTTLLDRDPRHGTNGGSSDSAVDDPVRRQAYAEAHRFYNYQIHKWIAEVTR